MNPYLQSTKTTNGFNNRLAAKNTITNTFSQSAYFQYMFRDVEANLLPFATGTYLGEKKFFNIGADFYHHPRSTYTLSPGEGPDSLALHSSTIVGVDVFMKGYNAKGQFNLEQDLCISMMDHPAQVLNRTGQKVSSPYKHRYFCNEGWT